MVNHLALFLLVWLVLPLTLAASAGGWRIRHRQCRGDLGESLLHQLGLLALAAGAWAALGHQPSPSLAVLLVLCWGAHQFAQKAVPPHPAQARNALWQQVLPALAVLLYFIAFWTPLRSNTGLLDDERILRAAGRRDIFWLLVCAAAAVWLLHVEELLRSLAHGTGAALRRSKWRIPHVWGALPGGGAHEKPHHRGAPDPLPRHARAGR